MQRSAAPVPAGTQLVACRQLPDAATSLGLWSSAASAQVSGADPFPDETKCRPVQPISWSASEHVVTWSSERFVPGKRDAHPGNSRKDDALRVTIAGGPSGVNSSPACEPPRLGRAPRQAGWVHSPLKHTRFAAVPCRPGFTCQMVDVPASTAQPATQAESRDKRTAVSCGSPLQKSSTAPGVVCSRRRPSVPPDDVRQISGRPRGCH